MRTLCVCFSILLVASCGEEGLSSDAIDASVPPPGGFKGPVDPARCGNGRLDPGEVCDDGFHGACGSCNVDCSGPGDGSTCGDGVHCPETEACDDGFTDECGGCNSDCTEDGSGALCGDGVVCPELETCDDGHTDRCGDCNEGCSGPGTGAAVCGDGDECHTPAVGIEACDDGYTDACGTCNADCTGGGTPSVCGDGELCPEDEVCDDDYGLGCGTCSCPESFLSDECGGVTSSGAFNAGEVYIFGTVEEGLCDRGGITHWRTPNTVYVGGDCKDGNHVIRPSDGRLIYSRQQYNSIYIFQCDGCPWNPSGDYPDTDEVLENDGRLGFAPCDPANGNPVHNIRISLGGNILHECFDIDQENEWYDGDGNAVTFGELVHLGVGNSALFVTSFGFNYWIEDIITGTTTAVPDLPDIGPGTARALLPDGFWLVMRPGEAFERWRIGGNGAAAREVTYATSPVPIGHIKVDATGDLFGIGRLDGVDVVLRFPTDGSAWQVVYDESLNVVLKLHDSKLFTGP